MPSTSVSLSYTVREGLAGFRRARFAVFASTSAIAVSLVMIGLFLFIGYEATQVANWLRQRVGEVELFIDERADERTAQSLHLRAESTPGVQEAIFVSKDEAREIFREEFGDEADIFTDQPFLPASIRVRLQTAYANPDSLDRLAEEFAGWNRVEGVVFNQPLLVKVQQNLRLVTMTGLIVGVFVLFAAIFLVANTIRLTIYARRLLIRTMKLVGATDAFIRRPFIVEGVAQGLAAGIAASFILWGIYSLMSGYLPQLETTSWLHLALLAMAVIIIGVMLGWAGSLIAVRRFIKRVSLH